jgi:hypothetical protein
MHASACSAPVASRALVIAYEHLVLAPDETLRLVLAHLATGHPTWRHLAIDRARLLSPSATTFREVTSRTPSEWVGSFADVTPHVLDATVALLIDAGLGAIYGASPEPLLGPDELRTSLRAD